MGLALLGALAGFAQGLGSRVEKEREENEELVKTRLQLAAVNKKKREEEAKAIREELSGRYAEVMPWLEPTTDEAVKLALISNPEIAKQFAQRRRDGETIDAATFVREKADEIRKKAPKGFETVRKYIDSFGVAPTPMTEEQMQQAFGQKEGFMGFNVGTKPGRAEKIASGLGVGSARELLAYENMQPLQKEPLADLATINTEQYGPMVDSVEKAYEKSQMNLFNAERRLNKDDPRLIRLREDTEALKAQIEAPVKSLDERANKLASQLQMAESEGDADSASAIKSQLDVLYTAIRNHKTAMEGNKPKSVATITASVEKAVQTDLESKYGVDLFSEPKTISLGDGEFYVARGLKSSVLPAVEQQIFNDRKVFARNALKAYGLIDGQGKPIYTSVGEVMYNYGIGRATPARVNLGGGTTPPATTPPAAARSAAPQAASTQPVADRKTRTRADIQVVVDGINKKRQAQGMNPTTYEEVKRAAEAEGLRVIEE
jgi:hypothetical protein